MLRMIAVSFVFGSLAVGLLLLCFAFGLAIITDARGSDSFTFGSGLLTIFSYERTPSGTETVFGTGTIIPIAGTVLWSWMPGRR